MIDAELLKAWGGLGISGALLVVLVIGLRIAVAQFNRCMNEHKLERNRWQKSDQHRTRETTKAMRTIAQAMERQSNVLSTVQCANFRKVTKKAS